MGIFNFFKNYAEIKKNNLPSVEFKNHNPFQPKIDSEISLKKIASMTSEINCCHNLTSLNSLFRQNGNIKHPQILYAFGVQYLIRDDKETAKEILYSGASYGIQYPCSLYSNVLIDSVGQCIALLMTRFRITDTTTAIKLTALSYIYLSRCIELYDRKSYDSYRSRGILFENH